MSTSRIILGCFLFVSLLPGQQGFRWPEGKRAAISLSFDDARTSQIDTGIALLEKHGAKATFFVSPGLVKERLAGWKRAVALGHEIGSHSMSHACTANYEFSARNALEDFTLEKMAADLDASSAEIERLLGVKPATFAYPCGQKFVGRGEGVRSYVPLVAARFLAGRGFLDEAPNDPALCDLAQSMGMGFDNLTAKQVLDLAKGAAKSGRWLIFVGHEIGTAGEQTTNVDALEALLKYARDPANGIWLDTVKNVATHVRARRAGR
ncbi:MAG: polysaccharide deacetylase family protein [Acidobacteriota bacterium]